MAQITCPWAPTGWRCRRPWPHLNPCALVPTWWNLSARWKYRGMS